MQKPKISLDKIEQIIDVDEMVGVELPRSLKEQIGQSLLDRIKERTDSGISVTGGKLKSPYSKGYQKSLNFKAAGKSGARVNMRLTGDMLETTDVDALGPIRLFVADDQTAKAYNHLTGDTVPKRNWFGVTQKEVSTVLADFGDDIDKIRSDQAVDSADTPDRLRAIDLFKDDANDDD